MYNRKILEARGMLKLIRNIFQICDTVDTK